MAKKRCPECEEHADESWLVPYADILTLLLALFIVLFASSKVDQNKFEQMAEAFKTAFSSGAGILESGTAPIPQVVPNASEGDTSQSAFDPAARESKQLEDMQSKFDDYITEHRLNDTLDSRITKEGLIIEIKDTMLFKPGEADISPSAIPTINVIADLIGSVDNKIMISGHTDNVPINTTEFPSNWDLSSKRALNFMKYILKENPDFKPERFSAVGYSQYRPISPNTTPEGRAKNRRIEVLIVRSIPLN